MPGVKSEELIEAHLLAIVLHLASEQFLLVTLVRQSCGQVLREMLQIRLARLLHTTPLLTADIVNRLLVNKTHRKRVARTSSFLSTHCCQTIPLLGHKSLLHTRHSAPSAIAIAVVRVRASSGVRGGACEEFWGRVSAAARGNIESFSFSLFRLENFVFLVPVNCAAAERVSPVLVGAFLHELNFFAG
jgi:hypothetical protein